MNIISTRIHWLLVIVICFSLIQGIFFTPPVQAASQAGGLSIEAIYGPNLIVDSNVESPSTYAPRSGSFAAKVCNNGATTLNDIFIMVGDYDPNGDTNPIDSTPGIYPSRTIASPIVGTFSLVHEGGSAGSADATRFMFSLAPGVCTIQYWVFSYPRLDSLGNSVTAGIKPDDDLWLQFDMWASARDGATTLNVDTTKTVTMRNEISASANKIWPNGDNKVPPQYLQAIADAFGWGTFAPGGGTGAVYPGLLVRTQGVWYDLGNVGAGFDNDGDFVPDHNAWLQPIGDPSIYDPGCFRLVRTFGILIVKLVGGGEKLIPFVDNLFFQNIPDNTGTVGLVYYEYAALDGACSASLSPYQEVASGFDNEKFNADFGVAIPPLRSRESPLTMDKTVDKLTVGAALPDTLTYSINFTNPGPVAAGAFSYGVPLVVTDAVPQGTVYVAGSATANNTLPAGVSSYRVLYSTNNGQTWTTTEPTANTVTTIQWWLGADMPINTTGIVRYQATVPTVYPTVYPPIVPNTAGLSFGNNQPFLEDTATTVVLGNNTLSGTVFRDNGTSGFFANGVKDTGEIGIPNVTLTLYIDTDNDGQGDVVVGTTVSDSNGNYSFANLPDGNFVVVVDTADPDLPPGYTNTNATTRTVALDPTYASATGVTQTGINFGFAPALTINKALIPTSTTAIYESDTVQYTIDLANKLPGTGSPVPAACSRIAWAEVPDTTSSGGTNGFFNDRQNVSGAPNNTYAYSSFANNTDEVAVGTFSMAQPGTITKVEALFSVYSSGAFVNDYASAEGLLSGISFGTRDFTIAELNARVGQANQSLLTWDVTALRTWTFADFAGTALNLKFYAKKVGSVDGQTIFIDTMGFRVTTNQTCAPTPATTINPLPLTDTYDATKLQFVSSVPPVDSSTPLGTLSWNNLGPLYPGGTKQVLVTFKALQPATSPVNASNTATVNAASFANGTPANTGVSTVTVPLIATGSIAGVVWSDKGTLGWVGGATGTGYQSGIDLFVPNVTVTLFACTINGVVMATPANTSRSCTNNTNGGTWTAIATTKTDATGAYRFDGLRDGFYRTVVDTTTLPGTVTQTGDPNVRTGTCGGSCDNQSNDPDVNLDTAFVGRIQAANDVINVNYGYTINPSLYGKIWEDIDGNGSQSTLEPILTTPSVTVNLYANATCTGAPVATTTTTNGTYRFPNLTAGTTYCVSTTTPAGFTRTGETDGSVNNQITKTLVAGEVSGSHDFGFRRTGTSTIGDTLYYDWNGNGSQQSSTEAGIPNVTVRLYRDMDGNGAFNPAIDALAATTTTNTAGQYLFNGLGAGNYIVVVDSADPDLPSFVYQTADPNEAGVCAICDNLSPVPGVDGTSNYLTHDFGYKPSGGGTIGDTVWFDVNGDGIQSGTQEVGIANVTVNLSVDMNGDGLYEVIVTTTTDADGHYEFQNLPATSYQVTVVATDPDLPVDAFGNPAAPTTPISFDIALPANATNLTADFGFAPLGAIGDTIFWDANGNGTQDWNETGIAGVSVTLCRDLNNDGVCSGAGETSLPSTVTDANGHYLFTGLPTLPGNGTYLVKVGPIPGNPVLTSDPNADGVVCTDPAAFGCDGQINVQMSPGANFMGADFGYQPNTVIGDTLWIDIDGDGVQDPTEIGIANITVRLCNASNVCITTTTDADGHYSFQNVANDTYTVTVDTSDLDFPVGLSASFDADGTLNNSTSVVVSGGTVTSVGGTPCSNCGLTADFGYQYAGPLSLSGTVCLDGTEADRVCGTGPTGVVTTNGEMAYAATNVVLVRWVDNGNGVIDPGETVTVGSTTTGPNGDYSFTGLPSGTYIVALASPDDNLTMVTLQGDTPASQIVTNGTTSAYQVVTVTNPVQNVDFAFQSTVARDFGDLPASYSTDLSGAPAGPSHIVSASPSIYLGAIAPDTEINGVPTSLANGDGADEDGVTFDTSTWVEGANGGSVTITVQGSGWLVGWVDLNKNGSFDQANEFIISQAVSTGTQTYSFDIPTDMISLGSRAIYSRFRVLPTQPFIPSLAYIGEVTGGEVEDHIMVLLTPTAISLISLNAHAQTDSIRVTWQTGFEKDTLGFNVYRSVDGNRASASKVNTALIAAYGVTGGSYSWQDTNVASGTEYTYWLEEVDLYGDTMLFGPVTARMGQNWQFFLPIVR